LLTVPDDFDRRTLAEREEILEWVRRVVVSGSTDYRRYQAAAMKHRSKPARSDPDDAPALTADFFQHAEVRKGDKVVRPADGTLTRRGRPRLERLAADQRRS
jgi:hypothetical protein